MQIEDVPFTATSWGKAGPVRYPGTTGCATWRSVERGNLRLRMVEYSRDFLQDR